MVTRTLTQTGTAKGNFTGYKKATDMMIKRNGLKYLKMKHYQIQNKFM